MVKGEEKLWFLSGEIGMKPRSLERLGIPAVSLADGTHLMDVLHPQMHRTGTDGLREAVVGIILMLRKILLPALNQTGWNGLRSNVHQSPLG